MKRYITEGWNSKIEEIEVSRETEKCYFVRHAPHLPEDRRMKTHNFHNTWLDAHAYLLNRAADKVERLKKELQRAESELATVQDMRQLV